MIETFYRNIFFKTKCTVHFLYEITKRLKS